MILNLNSYGDNISLLFSGGADSALLFYLLGYDIIKNNNTKNLVLFVIDRPNNPILHAKHIHKLIEKRLNFKFKLIELPIPKVPYYKQVPVASKIIETKKEFNVLLWGINRYAEGITPNHIFNFQETNFLKFPFKNYTKDILIQEYFNLGIEDILFETHSCGSDLTEPCKVCFNCRERKWAFDKINKLVDYGK